MRKNTHTHTHLQPVVTANRKKAGLRGREENLKVKMAEVRKKRKKKGHITIREKKWLPMS